MRGLVRTLAECVQRVGGVAVSRLNRTRFCPAERGVRGSCCGTLSYVDGDESSQRMMMSSSAAHPTPRALSVAYGELEDPRPELPGGARGGGLSRGGGPWGGGGGGGG
eukprot:1937329-Prymnesium_polylepis.1